MASVSFVRRAVPVVLATGMVFSLAACASTDAPTHSGAADAAMSAADSAAMPSYERKRGEALEPLQEEWLTGNQEASSADISLPMTAVFHDVRGGEHPDFYRVVLEFKRDSQTGSRPEELAITAQARWVDAPVSQGKGDTMQNTGQKFLDITLNNTTVPEGDQVKFYYAGDKNLTFGPIDVSIDGTFEGNTHVVVGMDEEREYQMSFLDGPTRLVIDIKK